MNFRDDLPKPLTPVKFYILLALCRGESRRYQLKGSVRSDSFGSMRLNDTQIYRAVTELHDAGLIDLVRTESGRVSGTTTEIYDISSHGNVRLQEEIIRMDFAVQAARHAGIMDETPTDIQRLMLDFLDGSEG